MMLPENEIVYKGQKIEVRIFEQTGGLEYSTALYQDKAGQFYVAYIRQERTIAEFAATKPSKEIALPYDDAEALEAFCKHSIKVSRQSESQVLKWYLREFMNHTPLRKLMERALFGPKI